MPMDPIRICAATIGAFIYIAGFIGNSFALLLFTQKELRKVSTGLLFLILNIVNTIHLLSLLFEFIDSLFTFSIFPSDVFRCQFIVWLQNSTRTICSFLATTISVDRFLRSEYPALSRIWCTPKNVLKLLIIYLIFSILLYAMLFHPLHVFDDQGYCKFDSHDIFHTITFYIIPPIRFALICVIPSSLMIICGCRMLYNIRQSRKRVTPQAILHSLPPTIAIFPISKITTTNITDRRPNVIATDRVLLLMVIINVVVYIITQLPFNTYAIYYGYEKTKDNQSNAVVRSYLLMWSSIYFGIGFYLFCFTSGQFRKQILTKIKIFVIDRHSLEGQNSRLRNN